MSTNIIDFGLGFGVVILLMQITSLILILVKKFPEFFMAVAYSMLFVDAIAIFVYALILQDYSQDSKLFIGGIGLAIFVSLIHKVKAFLNRQTY